VIVPSLPGYGFSEIPEEPGVTNRVADLWHRLLTEELGYARYGAAGGDMGSGVTQQLALKYPASVVGIHLTDVPWQNFTTFQTSGGAAAGLSETEQTYFRAAQDWMMREGAYAMIQSTKPQTLAYGLNDSPAALAAWIVEKFRAWSDCAGDVESRFTKDELLTNITLFWATETINSAFLYYYEPAHNPPAPFAEKPVETPTGFARFPKDLTPAPREWAERFFSNITRWEEMQGGGHFAALEEPEKFVFELREFFRPLR
jgi:microsomal epoxide hydrolase